MCVRFYRWVTGGSEIRTAYSVTQCLTRLGSKFIKNSNEDYNGAQTAHMEHSKTE